MPIASAGGTGVPEALAVVFVPDDPQHDLAESLDRFRAGVTISMSDPPALIFRQFPLQLHSLLRQLQEPLAPVRPAGGLPDEILPHQLAQHAAETLLGDPQN